MHLDILIYHDLIYNKQNRDKMNLQIIEKTVEFIASYFPNNLIHNNQIKGIHQNRTSICHIQGHYGHFTNPTFLKNKKEIKRTIIYR